jgi:hypothetical protein
MERLAETQAVISQFPWGRLERDGTFNFDVARARFGVLGGDGCGYWAHRGGPVAHLDQGDSAFSTHDPAQGGLLKRHAFLDGQALLARAHPADDAWKLPPRLVPFLDFARPDARRPVPVTELPERVGDWAAWHAWRRLPRESPAALLMAVPLSVFHLLVCCLCVTKPHAGAPERRVPLHVHFLGAEVELNYLPLCVARLSAAQTGALR